MHSRFLQHHCKSTSLCNAPSVHTVERRATCEGSQNFSSATFSVVLWGTSHLSVTLWSAPTLLIATQPVSLPFDHVTALRLACYLALSTPPTHGLKRSLPLFLFFSLRVDLHFLLVDVSDIFLFFLLGEGEGGVRGARKGRGSVFYCKSQEGRGVCPRGGGGEARGREGVCGEFGGELNIFFRGRNAHQVLL